MLILDLWGISFHPVVVVGLGNDDLLFNFIVGHCVLKIDPLAQPGFGADTRRAWQYRLAD